VADAAQKKDVWQNRPGSLAKPHLSACKLQLTAQLLVAAGQGIHFTLQQMQLHATTLSSYQMDCSQERGVVQGSELAHKLVSDKPTIDCCC
jgi:hypothetical protein